jgi:hypothetical protein
MWIFIAIAIVIILVVVGHSEDKKYQASYRTKQYKSAITLPINDFVITEDMDRIFIVDSFRPDDGMVEYELYDKDDICSGETYCTKNCTIMQVCEDSIGKRLKFSNLTTILIYDKDGSRMDVEPYSGSQD